MQSVRAVLFRARPPVSSGLGFGGMPSVASIHSTATVQKYVTDTEMVHKGVMYGFEGYPSRPNDPRVPSNPEFGITLLDKKLKTDESSEKRENISKAMRVYLERAAKHNEFMSAQEEEFELGRRHLANIMGVDESTMNQEDINTAIRYLMPSGLFDHRARPRMRPPKEIYPTIKDAQFQPNGRPFHSLFYTGKANFYQACFDLETEFAKLNKHQDSEHELGIVTPPPQARLDLTTSVWLSHMEMKQIFLEKVDTIRYNAFVTALDRLAAHPYSGRAEEFIMKFRKAVQTAVELMHIEPLKYDDNGRAFMDAQGMRKHCIAFVTVRGEGTGKVDINGQDILYFENIQDREQIMTPLKFVGLLGKVDIECRTVYEEETKHWSEDAPMFPVGQPARDLGTSSQSGAIRHALSLALKSFVDQETVEKMRIAGLLSKDTRTKERKKWGQEGARRKYTWKKR